MPGTRLTLVEILCVSSLAVKNKGAEQTANCLKGPESINL